MSDLKAYHKEWREKNPEKVRAYARKHYEANKDKFHAKQRQLREKFPDLNRNYRYKSYYGIDLQTYDRMLAEQGGKCTLCFRVPTKQRLHVDHDHNTKRVRGLLCGACNRIVVANCDRIIGYWERVKMYLEKS